MNGLRLIAAGVLLLGISGGLAGCSPPVDSSRDMVATLEGEPMPAGPVVQIREEEVLQLVKEQPAPDGGGTVEDWLRRELVTPRAQALFPRWTVQRRAASRFEVRFTFTWIDRANQIENRGYRWQVDGALRTVKGPEALAVEESARVRSLGDQQQRRAENPDYNLY